MVNVFRNTIALHGPKVFLIYLVKMVFICCVPTCEAKDVKTHSFPKNQEVCQKWICVTKKYKLKKETAASKHAQVCYKHFRKEDYTSNCFRFLKKGVIPSVDMPVPLNVINQHNYCLPDSFVSKLFDIHDHDKRD